MGNRSGIVCGIILTGAVATALAGWTDVRTATARIDVSRVLGALLVRRIEVRPTGLSAVAGAVERGLPGREGVGSGWTQRGYDATNLVFEVEEPRPAKKRGPLA